MTEFGDYDPLDAVDDEFDAVGRPSPMQVIYLTDLAAELRRGGVSVIEEPGWQTRGRRNGAGYEHPPTHHMVHHTASNTSARNDINYMTYNSPDAPLSNLYTARNGDVHVLAAGPTNTNGSGSDWWGGDTPANSMNSHAIGNEIGNTGVGEPYPQAQQDAVLLTAKIIENNYDIAPAFHRAHFEWAPSRKIDTTGPSQWSPHGGKWDMDAFRQSVFDTTRPPQGDQDMLSSFIWTHNDSNKPGAFYVSNGSVVHVDADVRDILIAQGAVRIHSTNTTVYDSYVRVAQGL